MAIPPPDLFVAARSAEVVGEGVCVWFEHARPGDPASIEVEWLPAFPDGPGGAPAFRVAVFERRVKRGVATCTGPVERQSRTFAWPVEGACVLRFNDPTYYGSKRTGEPFELVRSV